MADAAPDKVIALPREGGNPPAPKPPVEEKKPSLLSNILAIIGIVIFLIIIIWCLVHLASLSGSWFSSLFASTPSLELQSPGDVTSGVPFTLHWNYKPEQSGTYALLYACGAVTLSNEGKNIPCGTSYTTAATSSSLVLLPVLAGSQAATTSLSLVFVPVNGSGVQGNTSFTVHPALASVTPSKPAAPVHTYSGPADLTVRIMSVTTDGYGNGTAVFDIANVGSGISGSYYFQADLPTSSYGPQYYGAPQGQSYTYTSPTQISLAPGDHVTSTLRFTQATQGGVFSVTVDPSENVNDSNRTNNYAYQTLTANGYYQPQPYYTY